MNQKAKEALARAVCTSPGVPRGHVHTDCVNRANQIIMKLAVDGWGLAHPDDPETVTAVATELLDWRVAYFGELKDASPTSPEVVPIILAASRAVERIVKGTQDD